MGSAMVLSRSKSSGALATGDSTFGVKDAT